MATQRNANKGRIAMADPMTDLYEIHQVEREDMNEGWIWVKNEKLREIIENRRPVLLVEDTGSGKRVCCETLYADPTYLANRRRQPVTKNAKNNLAFLSAWYRRRLGIEKEQIPCVRTLKIRETNRVWTIWWQLRACARHPQIAVVMSTVLVWRPRNNWTTHRFAFLRRGSVQPG